MCVPPSSDIERQGARIDTSAEKYLPSLMPPGRRGRGRRSLSLRLGPDCRHAHPADRRLRGRRRVGAGSIYGRRRPVADDRRARVPARLDHPDGAAQGHRPHPAPGAIGGGARRARARRGSTGPSRSPTTTPARSRTIAFA